MAHLDGYRLSSPEDLASIGLDELLAEPDTVVAVEWPDRFGSALPEQRIDVRLEHVDAHSRRIVLTASPSLADRLEALTRQNDQGGGGGGGGRCPVCGAPMRRDGDRWPFCSARCRLIDLGRWLGGQYSISRALSEVDDELTDR